jgi:small-conductance mechanosensitive channel/CRP-like cAMP-binding protein
MDWRVEALLLACGIITAVIGLALNPWTAQQSRTRDATPAIVQDTAIVVLVTVAAMFVFHNSSFFVGLTGSAIVVGLALQDTLGNAFSGLAIQLEKPFRVGHWVAAAGHEGRVAEITWRATRLRTKDGTMVSVPNSVIVKEPIKNYSEPAVPTRLYIDVGASYQTPPNDVRAALESAMQQTRRLLTVPKPDVLVQDFAGSAITYRARFWIDEFEFDEEARDEVRCAIYYEFARRNIEIPWPIQVEYSRQEVKEPETERLARYTAAVARVPVFSTLDPEAHQAIAAAASDRLFGAGEAIVRQGDAGASMFIVSRGRVSVTIDQGREVARIEEGGVFGEMSLLTGEPRTATVRAVGDVSVLEIDASAFRRFVTAHPDTIERLADAAAVRRRELDDVRAAASGSAEARKSLVARMRRFFGLSARTPVTEPAPRP